MSGMGTAIFTHMAIENYINDALGLNMVHACSFSGTEVKFSKRVSGEAWSARLFFNGATLSRKMRCALQEIFRVGRP